jgi:hypothetical protein
VFNFQVTEVFDLFFYRGFYSINKLVLNFSKESLPLFSLINGIYITPNLPLSDVDPTLVNSIYTNNTFFCFIKLNSSFDNLLGLSFELTNTEILG